MARLTSTYTFVELEIPAEMYDWFRKTLAEAGYEHCFMDDGTIDMHGIGLIRAGEGVREARKPSPDYRPEEHRFIPCDPAGSETCGSGKGERNTDNGVIYCMACGRPSGAINR